MSLVVCCRGVMTVVFVYCRAVGGGVQVVTDREKKRMSSLEKTSEAVYLKSLQGCAG